MSQLEPEQTKIIADNSLSGKINYNTFLLSGSMATLYAMGQLVLAVATITFVSISGMPSLAGIGPAIFMLSGSIAAMIAGRTMDKLKQRRPVLAAGFLIGITGTLTTAYAISTHSMIILIIGWIFMGSSFGTGLLSRVAAADMYQPERRAWGIALVLFGAVFGALMGPLVFMPLYRGNMDALTITPWYMAAGFMLLGLIFILLLRPDPRRIAELLTLPNAAKANTEMQKTSLINILQRPGVATALFVTVTSYSIMVGIMSITSLLMVSHGHSPQSIFPVLSAHFIGMFGLVLFVGKFIEYIGRHKAMITGLIILSISTLGILMIDNMLLTMIALFGVGLGWSIAFVASNAELTSLTAPSERGGIIGLSDLISGITGATVTILGGILFAKAGLTPLGIAGAILALLPIYSVFSKLRETEI